MGITIHYSFGKIENPNGLLKRAKERALKMNWKILEDKKNCLTLHPHNDCESVDLEFKQLKEVRKIKDYDYIKNIIALAFQNVFSIIFPPLQFVRSKMLP